MDNVAYPCSFLLDLQAYDMGRGDPCQVWEQELYREMEYRSREPSFHSFEADREVAGICFADEAEARDFLQAVRSVAAGQDGQNRYK